MNQLDQETSPYLLQHAQNPVHWKAWNAAALEQAQKQNKLLLVSIGYSACHWCHVMEHESFEDNAVAAVMNAHYVNIKIDREERPDIDALYMKAVQIMTGRGGWPLNAICLPDGRPVYGGTYFRKPEWIQILNQLQELWAQDPEKMTDYAQKLHEGIQAVSLIPEKENLSALSLETLQPLVAKWQKSFDPDFGGMARAPKFPMPDNYRFLLHYAVATQDQSILHFTQLTLIKMAIGGLFDPIGGGFSRYSVDLRWHVPHFEKMLYDNAQLVSLYANAFKQNQNPLFKEVVEKTLAFVLREWTTAEGAFQSALDADSLDRNQNLEEGAFYVWTKPELQDLLGLDFEPFSILFSINDFGHWEHGNHVLIQENTLETVAEQLQWPPEQLRAKKQQWEQLLFEVRSQRPAPRLDDKCLTSWNAMMAKGFVEAYFALGNPSYLEAALRNATFLRDKQWTPNGNLWHSYKNGQSTISGYLEDYAGVIELFLSLYQATLDEQWANDARSLCDYCYDHFFDDASGFFLFTSNIDPKPLAPHFEVEDNVTPASNSIMAHNLYQLGILFENERYLETAQYMLAHTLSGVDYASAYSNWMRLCLIQIEQKELAVCGPDALEYMIRLQARYLPGTLLAGTQKPSALPFLQHRFEQDTNLFYLCHQRACQKPTTDFASVNKDLKT